MLEMGVPETMPNYMSVDIKPVFQEAFQNGGCKITCNGKPAWFKGQFPCFGKLAVRPQASPSWKAHAMTHDRDQGGSPLSHTVRGWSLPGAVLQAGIVGQHKRVLVHAQVKCFAGEEAPKYAPDFFAASCKGFWSGIFGHRVS